MFSGNLPVVMYQDIVAGVNAGQILEIICLKTAVKASNQYSGLWVFRLHADRAGASTPCAFIEGRTAKERQFRTITGLYSFARELGVSPIIIPNNEGESAHWLKAKTGDD